MNIRATLQDSYHHHHILYYTSDQLVDIKYNNSKQKCDYHTVKLLLDIAQPS